MTRKWTSLVVLIALAWAPLVSAAETSFFEGKTMRIIVGFSAGGGYDTYARAISRHLGKHIPGNPTIIVENMTGAGSLISANHLYRVAKPDGLTMGHFDGLLFLKQVLEQPGIEFDARKFELVGAVAQEEVVYAMTKASGISSVEKWMASKTPVKMGGVAPGATPDNVVRILKAALGLPIHVVSGYKGTADIRLACESGELAGAGWAWTSMKVTWRKALETGDVVVVLQGVPKPFPDLPNVPLAIDLAKTDEARKLIEMGIHDPAVYARPLVLPPGTPKDRVKILRTALQKMLKDKEFLDEMDKAKLDLQPVSGDELEKVVGSLFSMDSVMAAKLKDILYK